MLRTFLDSRRGDRGAGQTFEPGRVQPDQIQPAESPALCRRHAKAAEFEAANGKGRVNIFQKQLLLNGTPLAHLPDLEGRCRPEAYGPLAAPRRVTAEEFERTMAEIRRERKERVCHRAALEPVPASQQIVNLWVE